jgi:redox-sensitive bicupin YhaK (pirin superfamily)
MNRLEFIKKSLLGGTGLVVSANGLEAVTQNNIDELVPIVGFNHLPNLKSISMEHRILHKADTRGHANHGWLDSYHSFSFANYYNPERMNFGVLRVLNDDSIDAGTGFGTHPHDNMEIISIPLLGDLEHKDSMGNTTVIQHGDVQVMSAGSGITHSEYNKNKNKACKFLQIWVFPNKRNVTPRYDQITLKSEDRKNKFQQILSPNPSDEGVWIHQDAWFHLSNMSANQKLEYTLKKPTNGLYVFVLEGQVLVDNQPLGKRDGFGLWSLKEAVRFVAQSNCELLLMEVPMMS